MKKYLLSVAALILVVLGLYVGYLIFSPKRPVNAVDSQSIYSMLKQEGFLITQTYIVNQQAKINNSTGRIINDFLWRQEITAFATMKVNSGVDLRKLEQNDIQITLQKVQVALPQPEVQSVELIGELTVQNKQGILKRIFDNEDGYNLAYQTLRTQALDSAATTTLVDESRKNTEEEVERIIRFAVPDRQVEVLFKS